MLLTKEEVHGLIIRGQHLALAGDEETLKQLPQGKWIGGTIPYFMAEEGGVSTKDKIFVNMLPDHVKDIKITEYTQETISKVFTDAPENGFSLIIIPASCDVHLSFALNAPTYTDFATRPLIGWISGVHLDDLGTISAKIFNGETGESLENAAIVMHCSLPNTMYADMGIVNIFSQGDDDTIEFLEDGFIHKTALINGEERNLADYVTEKQLDIRFPLVADYFGIMVNVSFQKVEEEEKQVYFYAPLFKGMKYKQAINKQKMLEIMLKHLQNKCQLNQTILFFLVIVF
jgi:hypothetical protein